MLTLHSFDRDYLSRLAGGDPFVENHFTEYFGSLLQIKLRSRIRSSDLIDDIRQETLLRVLRTVREKGGPEYPERFGAFVNSVCNNVTFELLRSTTRQSQIAPNSAEPADSRIDMDAPLRDDQRKRQVAAILADMPEKDRAVLRMQFLEERDKDEVCRVLGVDADYLRVLLHRAKARFRTAMAKRKFQIASVSHWIFYVV